MYTQVIGLMRKGIVLIVPYGVKLIKLKAQIVIDETKQRRHFRVFVWWCPLNWPCERRVGTLIPSKTLDRRSIFLDYFDTETA